MGTRYQATRDQDRGGDWDSVSLTLCAYVCFYLFLYVFWWRTVDFPPKWPQNMFKQQRNEPINASLKENEANQRMKYVI